MNVERLLRNDNDNSYCEAKKILIKKSKEIKFQIFSNMKGANSKCKCISLAAIFKNLNHFRNISLLLLTRG